MYVKADKETETQKREQTYRHHGGRKGGMNWEIGIDVYASVQLSRPTVSDSV